MFLLDVIFILGMQKLYNCRNLKFSARLFYSTHCIPTSLLNFYSSLYFINRNGVQIYFLNKYFEFHWFIPKLLISNQLNLKKLLFDISYFLYFLMITINDEDLKMCMSVTTYKRIHFIIIITLFSEMPNYR